MKKILFCLFLLNISVGFAQSPLRLGVNFDLMVSWLAPRTNNIENDGARPGLAGGLIVEYYFHSNYGLITGLNPSYAGGNVLYEVPVDIKTGDNESVHLPAGSTVSYNLSYITIPVGLKLKTNEMGYITYFAQLGVNHQINFSSRASSTGNSLNKDQVSKEFSLINMSYFIGGGLEYNIGGQTSLFAGIFFNNGFIDVLSNNNHKAVLNYLTLRVGVLF